MPFEMYSIDVSICFPILRSISFSYAFDVYLYI